MRLCLSIFLIAMLFIGCSVPNASPLEDAPAREDLADKELSRTTLSLTDGEKSAIDALRAQGPLKVAMRKVSTVYEERNGEIIGYNYHLIQEFANMMDLDLDITFVDSVTDFYAVDGAIPSQVMTQETYAYSPDLMDQVHVYADTITLLPWREEASLMIPVVPIQELLIVRLGCEVSELHELEGKTLAIQPDSSYAFTMAQVSETKKVTFNTFEVTTIPETILAVSQGDADFTIHDSNRAFIEIENSDKIQMGIPVAEIKQVGWAVNKDHPDLYRVLMRFIEQTKLDGRFEAYWSKDYSITFTDYFQFLSDGAVK